MIDLHLLVTRPEPDGSRTAEALRALGHSALVAPLLEFRAAGSTGKSDDAWGGILVTSSNAIRALSPKSLAELKDIRMLAVGDHTADAARSAGFVQVECVDGNAQKLARQAIRAFTGTTAPILYLAGADRAIDLQAALAAKNIRLETVVVYRMEHAPAIPPGARAAIEDGRLDGVLHYSGRTVDAYLALSEAAHLSEAALAPIHYCLSAEIAAKLIQAGAPAVRIAAHPREADLFRLLNHR